MKLKPVMLNGKKMMYIEEVFSSIDGEVNVCGQGKLTTFIRLSGCNLRCNYCDTEHTQERNDKSISIEDLFKKIEKIGCKKLTITGGEPLMQSDELFEFLQYLNTKGGYTVTIETNGTYELIPRGFYLSRLKLFYVVDYKLEYPGKMIMNNFYNMIIGDWLKIPIRDKIDYDRAVKLVFKIRGINKHIGIAFSPINGEEGTITAKDVLEWLTKDKLFFIQLNCQLHKLISVS